MTVADIPGEDVPSGCHSALLELRILPYIIKNNLVYSVLNVSIIGFRYSEKHFSTSNTNTISYTHT